MIIIIFDSVSFKTVALNMMQFIKLKQRFIVRIEDRFKIPLFLLNGLLYIYNLGFSKQFVSKNITVYIRNGAVINKNVFINHFSTSSKIIYYGDSIVRTKNMEWYEARPNWSNTLYGQIDYLGDVIVLCNIDLSSIGGNLLKFIYDKKQVIQIQRIEEALSFRSSIKTNIHKVPQLNDSINIFHRRIEQHGTFTDNSKDKISICIPTAFKKNGDIPIVINCLESLEKIENKDNYEITLCFHRDQFAEFQKFKNKYLEKTEFNFNIYQYSYDFNFSKVMNDAIELSTSNKIILLNDDVEIEDASKVGLPFNHFSDIKVGAVGVNLFFSNGTIQHAGIEYRNGEPQHFLKGSEKDFLQPWTSFCREVSGVTGAVLYLKKDVFMSIGKFDESFPLDYGDVDFMLRLRNFGYEVLICTAVSGIHLESSTRSVTPIVDLESKLSLLINRNHRLPIRDSFLITCAERTWI
jgi:hypothetical protein